MNHLVFPIVLAFQTSVASAAVPVDQPPPEPGQLILPQRVVDWVQMDPEQQARSVNFGSKVWVLGIDAPGETTIGPAIIERFLEVFGSRFGETAQANEQAETLVRAYYRDHLERFRSSSRLIERTLESHREMMRENVHRMQRELRDMDGDGVSDLDSAMEASAIYNAWLERSNDIQRSVVREGAVIADQQHAMDDELLMDLRSLLPTALQEAEWPAFRRWVDRERFLNRRFRTFFNEVTTARTDLFEVLELADIQPDEVVDADALAEVLERYEDDLATGIPIWVRRARLAALEHQGNQTDEERRASALILAEAQEAGGRLSTIARRAVEDIKRLLTVDAAARFEETWFDVRGETQSTATLQHRVDQMLALDDLTEAQRESIEALRDRYLPEIRRVRQEQMKWHDRTARLYPPGAARRALATGDVAEQQRLREAAPDRGELQSISQRRTAMTREMIQQMRRLMTTEQLERLPALPPGW